MKKRVWSLVRDLKVTVSPTALFLFCAFSGGLFSCATNPASSPRSLTDTQKNKLREFEAELELGRNMASRLLATSEPLPNKKVVDYINDVGLYIARYSDAPERKYMFEVLNDNTVNAFACPGGYIFVTAGALRMAENEAELAAILGHEIAHVSNQHMLKAIKGKDFKTVADKEKELTPKGDGSTDTQIQARMRPEPPQSELGRMMSQYLMGPGGAGLSLFAAVDAGMGILLKEGLDQKLEFEADRVGTRIAIKAGYEPQALIHYFSRMQAEKQSQKALTQSLEKTHPKTAERKDHLTKYLALEKKDSATGAGGKERFDKIKALLLANNDTH